jgi:hypothetical protein
VIQYKIFSNLVLNSQKYSVFLIGETNIPYLSGVGLFTYWTIFAAVKYAANFDINFCGLLSVVHPAQCTVCFIAHQGYRTVQYCGYIST